MPDKNAVRSQAVVTRSGDLLRGKKLVPLPEAEAEVRAISRMYVSSVKRYDVINGQFTTSSMKYNTAGAVVSSKDALNHEVTISYADSFSDGNNSRNTFAYPTTVTDPDGYSSTSRYHFDFGAVTRKQTPLPNVTTNTPGPEQTFIYDEIGRLERTTSLVNSAYTRYEYYSNGMRVDTYATIQDERKFSYS